jgi:hypothetical protein
MNETAASADPAYQAGIGGGHDIPYNQAAADYLINHVHSAQKAAIDDAAHLPNMDQPDEFRRIVTSFEEGGVPVTPQTLFAYGSICKNICAALVMRLVEEGRLHLDRPIVEYLPDLRFTNNETYGRQITLRHLLNVESADLITIGAAGDQLILERQGESRPLTPIGGDEFYAEVSQTARLSVAFLFDGAGEAAHALIGGEPYQPVVLDPDFAPDLDLWQAYVGLYRDPSNMDPAEMVRVRLQDGVLSFTEGEEEAAAKAISNRCFLSELGLFAFEDTAVAGVKTLVRGKAVRYYPLKISGLYSHEHC